jgi:hypothetical protein
MSSENSELRTRIRRGEIDAFLDAGESMDRIIEHTGIPKSVILEDFSAILDDMPAYTLSDFSSFDEAHPGVRLKLLHDSIRRARELISTLESGSLPEPERSRYLGEVRALLKDYLGSPLYLDSPPIDHRPEEDGSG